LRTAQIKPGIKNDKITKNNRDTTGIALINEVTSLIFKDFFFMNLI
jgi:hypothetical protein